MSSKRRNPQNADAIHRRLKEMILNFEFYPGTRLTEGELSERFGVSRTPIREAVQRLEMERLMTVRPKQGCFVRALDIDEINDYYQVRMALERLMLQLVIERMPRQALLDLAAEWAPSQIPTDVIDVETMALRDESFHLALATGCGNRVLVQKLREINEHIHIIRRLDFTDAGRIEATYREHHALCQCLLDGRLDEALALLQSHIERSQEFSQGLTLRRLAEMRTG
jgi:DNA-binding GntR family transcriptional regulator